MFLRFAFVQFETAEEVKEAIEKHQGVEIEGRAVFLDFQGSGKRGGGGGGRGGESRGRGGRNFGGGDDGPVKTLVCHNLSYDTSEDTLREFFEDAEGMKLVTDRDTGRSKG